MTTAITGEAVGEHRVAVTVRAHELVPYARALLERGYRVALVAGHDDGDARCGSVYLFTRPARTTASSCTCRCDPADPHVPSLAGLSFPAGRFEREMQRPVRHRPGRPPAAPPAGPALPLAPRLAPDAPRRRRPAAVRRRRRALPVPHRRGPRGVRDPGRTGARRDDRTRPLPVLRRRRDHPEPQGPAVVRAPRHRETLRGPHPRATGSNWPNGSAATPPSATRSRSAGPSRTPTACRSTDATQQIRAILLELERLYNHVTDIGALCNDVGHGILNAHAAARPRTAAADQRPGHRAPAAPRRDPIGGADVHRAARPRRPGRRSPPTSPRSSPSPWRTASSGTGSPAPPC